MDITGGGGGDDDAFARVRGAYADAAAAAGVDPDADDGAARLAALDPFPDVSEEELVAMLEAYERSAMSLGPVPEDLAVSLAAVG